MERAKWLGGAAAICAVLGGLVSPAAADTVVLSATKDNTMFEEDGTLSNGAGDYLFAGNTKDEFARRGLIAFDVASAIPSGSTIDSVTLTLTMSRTKVGDLSVALHRATSDWGEGDSHADGEEGTGIAAEAGDATWTHTFWDTDLWTSAGGDFASTASGSTLVGREGTYTWSSAGMVSDVQDWLDGAAPNYGWVVIGDEAGVRVAKRFDSRTHPDTALRPALTIDFTSTGASGACCAADGACTVTADAGSCGGSYQGNGTSCSPNPCAQPAGACCHPDAAATCTLDTEADCTAAGADWQGASVTCSPSPCPVVLTKWLDPLPMPKVATPTSGSSGGAADYSIAIKQFTQQLHSELPATTLWGYDDGTGPSFPGPTIEARTNEGVTVTWLNDLRDDSGALRTDHILPVQSCLHGAETNAPRVVTHLHGGHVAARFDGYPEDTLLPGESAVYEYPNWQQAAQIWYHDHALGITRHNVYMGLAALYTIRDSVEDGLALPSGAYEVPLVIQDRTFEPDGSLYYPAGWQEHFFGDTLLVNGKAWPYLEVDQGKYRFRVVNGSNSRTYTLSLSTGDSFQIVGNDGGLLEAPQSLTELTLTPAERADLIVDFEGYAAGTEITLQNSAGAPYPGSTGVIPEVMQFRVTSATGHTGAIPGTLATVTPLQEPDSVATRDFELEKVADSCQGVAWRINGLGWEDITETPQLGTTEIWRFINKSGTIHPMHMHLVFFQVLDRTPIEFVDGSLTTTGPAQAPEPHEQGWKDTVTVGGDEMVRVIAHFEDFTGLFPYHCHILEHEDHEMMRQFRATTTCGDGARGLPEEDCDGDGETASCDADCTVVECGDGTVNATAGETCDPPSSCPSSCDDGNACTADSASGDAATCDLACTHDPITTCADGDGCCPSGCDATTDDDCSPSCGNGTLEAGETCDPPSSCPTDCDDADACTVDSSTGSADNCNLVCTHDAVTSCTGGDGCCPAGCNTTTDSDCSATCGNSTVEAGETCDPPSSCPTDCDDADACTVDSSMGSAANCNFACMHTEIVSCTGGDGCCPAGCDLATDDDCVPGTDGGVPDGGTPDTDGGAPDGGVIDAGGPDAGPADAGRDAGAPGDAATGDGAAADAPAGDAGTGSGGGGGCGCGVTRPPEAAGAWLGVLGLLGLLARRRRDRSG